MSELSGIPSDEFPAILAKGDAGVTTIYMSMSARHPQGRDVDYLRWHTFDCRPEQHRLTALRASLRLVSTPECRAARTASEAQYDGVDHVMTYLFTEASALQGFADLSAALRDANRKPYMDGRSGLDDGWLLPQVEQGVYRLAGKAAAPRVKVGADVLPWLPARGVYLLVEQGHTPPTELVDVDGVTGAWWGISIDPGAPFAAAGAAAAAAPLADAAAVQASCCFLDEDPVEVADRLRPALEKRWADGTMALLAAPFHLVSGYEFDRHLP